eukprot:IDg5311t1
MHACTKQCAVSHRLGARAQSCFTNLTKGQRLIAQLCNGKLPSSKRCNPTAISMNFPSRLSVCSTAADRKNRTQHTIRIKKDHRTTEGLTEQSARTQRTIRTTENLRITEGLTELSLTTRQKTRTKEDHPKTEGLRSTVLPHTRLLHLKGREAN